jgi:hypothetical protein
MIDTITQNILTLSKSEQQQLFKIMTAHAGLISKILPGMPLIESIQSGRFNSSNDPVIQAYLDWKNTK